MEQVSSLNDWQLAEWTRAINALGSVGRRAEQAERDRDSARADSERLKAAARNLQELVEGLRQDGKRLAAERDQARAERDAARVGMEELREVLIAADKETTGLREQLKRVRGLHRGVCVGACGLDDACECEERDLACDECSASWPCDTIRALDGTEAAR